MRQTGWRIPAKAEFFTTSGANWLPKPSTDHEGAMTSIAAQPSQMEKETMRKVTFRIIPFLMVCYFIAFVDRVNAGFAALQMNQDIGLSSAAFGLGGGLFYITYVLCEVPSNLAMEKVGARLWIARIMISWGIVAACMALVVGPYSF